MSSNEAITKKCQRYHANQIADAQYQKMFYDTLSYKIDWSHRIIHKIKTLDSKI